MKPIIAIFLTIFLFLACARSSSTVEMPAALVSETSIPDTLTPTLTPSLTNTPIPDTLIPDTSTPTVTPLPTIPTFTPTFDVRTIVTATPGISICPKENPVLTIDLGLTETTACIKSLSDYYDPNKCLDRELQTKILKFLNQGGNINKIVAQLRADGRQEYFVYQDLTHDGINDLVFRNADSPYAGYYFYTCKDGIYKSQPFWDGDSYAYLMTMEPIRDLNANGLPEIVITAAGVLVALEWNGVSFEEAIRIDDYGESYFEISDIDGNGQRKIVLSRGFPPHWNKAQEFPWRHYVSIYAWNGSSYVRISRTFDAPAYRFQAIQDADQYLVSGNYQKAIELYQEAIFNNELGWWSPERRNFELDKYFSGNDSSQPTLSPASNEETTEYPRLAAYAYYRMVILHTFLGEMDAAQVKYAMLQEKFPAGNPGHPYVEMATDFWNAYQSSGQIYNACAAAIAYADAHPEILTPLGSDYHGAQSHTYVPADVCPFR